MGAGAGGRGGGKRKAGKAGAKRGAGIRRAGSRWVRPYPEHPRDQLRIRMLFDEKISGSRMIALEARIRPGEVHRLHYHEDGYAVVYSLKGRCRVTVGGDVQDVGPRTVVYIQPGIPHRFENRSGRDWEGVAFAVGSGRGISSVWME